MICGCGHKRGDHIRVIGRCVFCRCKAYKRRENNPAEKRRQYKHGVDSRAFLKANKKYGYVKGVNGERWSH